MSEAIKHPDPERCPHCGGTLTPTQAEARHEMISVLGSPKFVLVAWLVVFAMGMAAGALIARWF